MGDPLKLLTRLDPRDKLRVQRPVDERVLSHGCVGLTDASDKVVEPPRRQRKTGGADGPSGSYYVTNGAWIVLRARRETQFVPDAIVNGGAALRQPNLGLLGVAEKSHIAGMLWPQAEAAVVRQP